jgi:CRISPR-associated endonuclease/helicase Cas3
MAEGSRIVTRDTESATSRCYAHSLPHRPESEWEPLEVHLQAVAERAGEFAAAFGAREWGGLAGLWHDLGKYKTEFQARLRGSREQVEHAGTGAALAMAKGSVGHTLAFVIAGHHAGLPNRAAQGESGLRSLADRIRGNAPSLDHLRSTIPTELFNRPLPALPAALIPRASTRSEQEDARRRIDFWTRFLFSALVDADRLATEDFYEPGKRDGISGFDAIPVLREKLDRHLARFSENTQVNRIRARVLEACRAAANRDAGLFSLTVPTGGGKTLSSMAFALEHAERHGMRRVIVVIPYTSIIEQNARVYRDVFGAGNVVEHHSNIDEPARLEEYGELESRRRLAAENWDAPVIVTTNVQFFESLFSNHPSRCRKLHNVARSVILIDEAQNVPAEYLDCVLNALRELTDGTYGCSVVLMTATQPALQRRDSLPSGLKNVTKIIQDPDQLARSLERVTIRWPSVNEPPTPLATLATAMAEHPQVLAIVHLRRDARELAHRLPDEHRYHLSALMCPTHRTETLKAVRGRLAHGLPCRLVSTQLIEAGVDIDFPVVYRALAGLDNLAQAAGRCNREGKLLDDEGVPRRGVVHVFRSETEPPPGILRLGLESTKSMLARHGDRLNFAEGALLDEYFHILYSKCETDRKGVQAERAQLNFATVASKVRLIEDAYSHPVVVPWADSARRVDAFRADPGRDTQRALQPYLVQIPERELNKLRGMRAVERIHDHVDVLMPLYAHLYDAVFGLVVDADSPANPNALIA